MCQPARRTGELHAEMLAQQQRHQRRGAGVNVECTHAVDVLPVAHGDAFVSQQRVNIRVQLLWDGKMPPPAERAAGHG